ncbi:hypothetical protein LCGC14_2553530 [marine sediment metagenome]|uniref:Uncharacterized protein n=1 Tax=marine sediment metagenome TaxID=412755 RepID=A0A0F9DFC5_9ZZZZ
MGRSMEGKGAETLGPLKQVRPWHRAMARAVATGARPNELAAMFEYSQTQISVIMGSPLFEAEVARLEAQADGSAVSLRTDLLKIGERAAEILDRETEKDFHADGTRLNEKEVSRQVQISFGVLDRIGHGPKAEPPKGGPDLHLHQHVHVDKMSDAELYRDVIGMTQEEEE